MDDDSQFLPARHRAVLEGLGDREPSTVLEAQAVIESIRAEKGYLDEETLQDLNSIRDSSRQNILRIIEQKQEMEAAYTRRYRFLYELIQNADDSLYTQAHRSGTEPFLEFNIAPSSLTIETNEDGFTRANVEAICATGKSSKNASALADHIGEKGFGFKSVFAVADKVHIQSGVWSFDFEHRRGQNGLGMVTPLDSPRVQLPERVATRITLTLADTTPRAYERLLGAVADLPDTAIFFLRKMKRLVIRTDQTSGEIESIVIQKITSSSGRINLSRERELRNGSEIVSSSTESSDYLVVSHTIGSMPHDECRQNLNTANVELAFPIDESSQPKLSRLGQYVFAYLPLQRFPQLQFLIQSDFITSASRESVVDCAWNDAIRNGVAKAFKKAIITFNSQDHPLRYSWLNFLPTQPMENFWRSLNTEILGFLRAIPVLQTWERRMWNRGSQLRIVPSYALHNGLPIFKDLRDEQYLAPEYHPSHFETLKALGVEELTWPELLERLRADLVGSQRMKTYPPEHDWHKSWAKLFLRAFRPPRQVDVCRQLKRLAIIPLTSGAWTSAPALSTEGVPPIYFPKTNNIPIPDELGLHLVERRAASLSDRAELFRALGVKACPMRVVLTNIERLHRRRGPFTARVPSMHLQFRYLFHFHHDPTSLSRWLLVPTQANTICGDKRPYFLSSREYDTQQLLPPGFETARNGVVEFLSNQVVDIEPPDARSGVHDLTWHTWLEKVTGARYHPPLVEDRSMSILGDCQVPCQDGEEHELREAFVPSEEIKGKVEVYGLQGTFPLLELPVALNQFYKAVLQKLASLTTVTVPVDMAQVYASIANSAPLEETERLREFFTVNSLICISSDNGVDDNYWASANEVLWQGPCFLTVRPPLQPRFHHVPVLATFFPVFLGIRDANIDDILDELEEEKINTELSLEAQSAKVTEIYRYLNDTSWSHEDWQSIRSRFTEQELIFASGRWYSPSRCLWSSPFYIHDRAVIGDLYPDQRAFFVNRFRIETASASLLITQLRRMAQERRPRFDEMRELLLKIGMIVAKGSADEGLVDALNELIELKFLPMKNAGNECVLVGVDDDFAISDHPRFEHAFRHQSILLDFNIEESQILDSLFQKLSLVHRYLSVAVRETSTVGQGALENHSLTNELRAKAYALYRCAAKFKSVMALRGETDLFEQLSNLQLFTTDDISTSLTLNLRGRTITVRSDRIYLHSEFRFGRLKLYVPQDRREQQWCYKFQLPTLFSNILGISSPGATFDISTLLRCDAESLDDEMQGLDIAGAPWIERPPRPSSSPSTGLEDSSISTLHISASTSQARMSARSSRPGNVSIIHWDNIPNHSSSPSESNIETPRVTSVTSRGSGRASLYDGPPPRPYMRPDNFVPPRRVRNRYRELLDQVITCAARASGEDDGAFNLRDLRDSLLGANLEDEVFDHVATFGERARNQFAHDKKIGAAGELYVFEILSNLDLPDFGRNNWKSTIRGEVNVHPKYHDLENWAGTETSDFYYVDQRRCLRLYLMNNCFGGLPEELLPIENWLCYIEVKTTTSACSTRFFLSHRQHRMVCMSLTIL
ncbi:hypothetical protein K469DRAFT_690218 [Zopfia rhizophila CBS 207.26]|uniref:Uncharacterized protein n=1 Tax=Zopfia rhizophila CBS 207.26 TaxID=1314779 RepID=A0A6A6DXV8_9PEZI|nr:hypothetical protein K469DRAFT_690218 [Zopfia rhizophila CBS 207.26]